MQHDAHNSTDMRVSAIPLTPVRTRDREQSKGYNVDRSTPNQYGRSARSAPRFEDIMNERPDPSAMYHQSLPEDHLEDILTLPIAAELRSRRSKASLASDRTTSTTAFPSSSTNHMKRQGAVSITHALEDTVRDQADIQYPHRRNESLRKRSKSSPMRADSPSTSDVDLSLSPSPNEYNNAPDQSLSFNSTNTKKAKTAALSPSSRNYPPPTPPSSTSASKLRNRAVTNNVTSSNTRKSPLLNGSAGTSRRPLQATNSSTNRQVSTPLKKPSASTPPTRVRSSSTSLLSNSIHHDWDEHSKPPWLDESPVYLYKSDIEGIQPGSLADIARHAQGRSQVSTTADGDNSFQGDTSVRSWDDVILPAVAKQIRAQQILEMQKNARVSAKNTIMTQREASGPGDPNQNQLPADPRALSSPTRERRRTRSSTYSQSRSASMDEERSYANPSMSSQHLGFQQGQQSAPVDANTISDASRSSHQTGRRELWDSPALASPGTASRTGFPDYQKQHMSAAPGEQRQYSYLDGHGVQDAQGVAKEDQRQSALKKNNREDGHKGGCCTCIIM